MSPKGSTTLSTAWSPSCSVAACFALNTKAGRCARIWDYRGRRTGSSALEEGEQVGVDDLGLCRGHPVREALIGLELTLLQQLQRKRRGIRVGDDLVVVAVHDQHWDVDLLQVLGEVGLGERLDAIVVRL